MTKNEDISKPFEVIERQILEVENVVEKNKDFTIYFSVSFTPYWTLVNNFTRVREMIYFNKSFPDVIVSHNDGILVCSPCPSEHLNLCHFQFLHVGASHLHCLHPV